MVEKDAGAFAQFPDHMYAAVGAEIVSRKSTWKADIVVSIYSTSWREPPLSTLFLTDETATSNARRG